jgi:hypothetical protein
MSWWVLIDIHNVQYTIFNVKGSKEKSNSEFRAADVTGVGRK